MFTRSLANIPRKDGDCNEVKEARLVHTPTVRMPDQDTKQKKEYLRKNTLLGCFMKNARIRNLLKGSPYYRLHEFQSLSYTLSRVSIFLPNRHG